MKNLRLTSAIVMMFFSSLLTCTSVELNAQFQLQDAFPSLTFSSPVGLYDAGDGTDRIFIVQQGGIIKVFENNRNTTTSKTFLNITDQVTSGGETGLLGLAFHPDYENNHYFYVDYTAASPLRTVIARYEVSALNPDSAIKNSELILLEINQPFSNHNGGQITFGPDGYLYIGMGDGGSGGDPFNNGQNLSVLLGKILRIDVDNPQGGMNYGIPETNPFYNNTQGYKEEIYSYGMRNPWRFSFDPNTGLLWCGDVGQDQWEEIDVIVNGGNYGWRCYEGNHPYNTSGCTGTDYLFPVFDYQHTGGNCSITGGFIYRGNRRTELTGDYIYGDYCSKKIWQLHPADSSNVFLITAASNILSFGVDMNNEFYLCSANGKIYEFIPGLEAPTGLLANPTDPATVELSWTDNSSTETGFKIERKGVNNIYEVVGTVGADEISFTDMVPVIDTYTYRVTAFNDAYLSNYSNTAVAIVTTVPVELKSFTALVKGDFVQLNWTTATETNNSGFDVERKQSENNNWEKIIFVNGHGTTTEQNSYSVTDKNLLSGTYQYRLKQIDFDGSFEYSNIVDVSFMEPDAFSLEQNYPNPFNPTTRIKYIIPNVETTAGRGELLSAAALQVTLKVYGILGNEVATLVNEQQAAGIYEVEFDALNLRVTSLPSGVYYYKLTAGSLIETKKMILLK